MTNNVNLLPTDIKESYTLRRRLVAQISRFSAIFVLLLELITILSYVLSLQAYLSLKISEKKAAAAVLLWNEKKEEEENLRSFQKKAEVFRIINEGHRVYSGVLTTLTELVPTSVALNQLQLSQEKVKISAQTGSVLAFASLIGRLFSSPNFREVVLTESEYVLKEGLYKITLEVPLIPETLFR